MSGYINQSMKKIALIILAIMMAIITACAEKESISPDNISTFDECVSAGNPVMESYPQQCKANDKTFVEQLKETEQGSSDAEQDTDKDPYKDTDKNTDTITQCLPKQRKAEVCL